MKIIRSLLSLFAVLALAACQGLNSPAPQPTSTATGRASPTPARSLPTATISVQPSPTSPPLFQLDPDDLMGVSVTFMHPWTGDLAHEAELIVADFNLENEWNIRADAIPSGSRDRLFSTVAEAAEMEQGVNLVAAPPEFILGWQQSGVEILDLNPFLNDPFWGLTGQQIADFTPTLWHQDVTGQMRFGIPAARTAHLLFYNRTWARELGFSKPPATVEEFEEQACAAADTMKDDSSPENDGTGGWIVSTGPLTALSWLKSFGIRSLPAQEETEWRFDNQNGRQAFRTLRAMYDEGCAWSGRQATPYEYFADRMALFYSGSMEDIPIQVQTNAARGSNDEWTVLPYPAAEKPVFLVSGDSYALVDGSEETRLASWLLLKWLARPDNQARLAAASGTMPSSVTAIGQMQEYAAEYPQWSAALQLVPLADQPPQLPTWRLVQPILQDAFWQTFQTTYITPEMVPGILRTLDDTIEEVLGELGR